MKSYLFRTALYLALATSVAEAACSPGDDADAQRAESDLGVRPKDDGTRLTIALPAGWSPSNAAGDATAMYRNAAIPIGVAQGLGEGDGTLVISSKFEVPLIAGKVTLEKGKETRFALGAIEPTYLSPGDASSTLHRDFGPTPQLAVYHGVGEQLVHGLSGNHMDFWDGSPPRPILAPPGVYRFSWTLPILAADDRRVNLAGGQRETIDLTPPDRRATIVVKKPTVRELPDVRPPQCHLATRTFLMHRSALVEDADGTAGEPPSADQAPTTASDAPLVEGRRSVAGYATSWAALPMKNDTTVKVFPFAATDDRSRYDLVVNNVNVPLALAPGDTRTIQLERLDVYDVEAMGATGNVQIRGTWKLLRQGPAGTWLPITARQDCAYGPGTQESFPTNRGLDVLPGTYRIIVSYTTDGPKTQEYTVTVP